MDSKDLRIGNYIYDRFELIAVVEEIRQHSVKLSSISNDGYKFESYSIEEVLPIPLTEEWLLKFGFKELEICQAGIAASFEKDGIKIRMSNSGNFYYRSNPVYYVHKLQNLFYELKDKELIFI